MGGGAARTVTHRYRGTLKGDTIQFLLEMEGGFSPHPPIHFTARRVKPVLSGKQEKRKLGEEGQR